MKNIIFVILLTISMCINAVIPEFEVWSDGINYRYFFKDVHVDYLDAMRTLKQHQDIVKVAQQVAPDSFVLTEDVASQITQKDISFEDHVQQVRQYHKSLNTTGNAAKLFEFSPLSLLKRSCQKYGIKSCNVECQAPVLRYSFLHNGMTKEQHLSQQQDIINKLSCYLEKTKGNVLFERYNLVDNELARLKSIPSENVESFLRQAFSTRFLLLEARILHKLALLKAYKHGFICVGNTHIERIKSELSIMGYNHLKTVGVSILQTLELTNQVLSEQATVEGACDVYNKTVTSQTPLLSQVPESMQDKVATLISSALDISATMDQVFKEQQ
jgi:hypothetical protein